MGALSNAIATLNPYLFYKCGPVDAESNSLVDSGGAERNMAPYSSYLDLCFQPLGPYRAHRFKKVISGTTESEPGAFPAELRTRLSTDPLHNTGDTTLTFLIRFNEAPAGVYRLWSCDGNGESLETNILTAAWFQDAGSGWQFYAFHEHGTGGTNVSATWGPVFAVGQTYHVVFRRVTSTKTWSLFVDGEKFDQAYSDNPQKHGTPSSNRQWAKFGGSSAGTTEIEMDDSAFAQFALWNEALTDQQIANLYAAWEADQEVQALSISGFVKLDGDEAQARVLLLESESGELRAITHSDPVSGYYAFEDVTGAVMAPGEDYFLLCDYGNGVRPLAHGPITPVVS